MTQAAKKLFFDIPGIGRVHAMPGGTVDPGGFSRDMKMSDLGPAGYTEEPMPPSASFKIAKTKGDGLSKRKLSDLKDINLTITDDLGNVDLMRKAFTTKPVTFSDGEYDIEMQGFSMEEVS